MSVMGKEASLEGLEFDGETVLCRVCGDKASGFHYGVHACEGCKGFFRRSIQQKIQYRPCLKNQQCNIMRVNRNRCQYCRLKKCISVGMSRDAVRFGRVPKKEKARIIEQMQKVNAQSQTMALFNILQSELDVIQAVINAHRLTCDFQTARVHQMREAALQSGEFVSCPAHMACPLNNQICGEASGNKNDWVDYSESFTPVIKSVVDFARGIPGFILLNQDDQVTLLKAGTFEVLLVRLAILFDPETDTMMFTGGKLFKRHSSPMPSGAGFLLDSMFDFADRLNRMHLTDDEIGLFSAIVLLSPDRPGLRNVEQTERIQNRLTEALQNMINANHKEDSTLFAKLLMKTTDLRTLNTLHSEKSIAGRNNIRLSHEHRERLSTDELEMEFQDGQSVRSGRSTSPTPSEASNMTMTSGFSDAASVDGNGASASSRPPFEAAAHQQVVLRTPYGTFYREEMSGFYAMVPDQPRRRCNTLDRDTLTRPRLHTIEEGNRRRYTLDRDYINKMVNKLSDRLEKRTAIRSDNSVPASISNSAASSPIPEEKYPYLNSSREFVPISRADSTISSSCGSPTPDGLHVPFGSSPTSPGPRSRSGSFGQEDCQMRPRCYSFHLNSEGRASRTSLPPRHHLLPERESQLVNESQQQQQYLSAEMRRGSVGASYGLHARKKSLLVDRHPSYLNVNPELMRHEAEKRIAHNQEVAKLQRMVQEQSLYNRQSLYPVNAVMTSVQSPPTLTSITSQDTSPSKSPPQPDHSMPVLSIANVASHSQQPSAPPAAAAGGETRSGEVSPTGSKTSSDDPCQEIFHKKFDKMRKHVMPSAQTDDGEGDDDGVLVVDEDEDDDDDVDSNGQMEVEMEGESCINKSDKSELLALMQRTPGEAHPNLLAHLKSPAKIQTQPPAPVPAVTYPWIKVPGSHLRKVVKQQLPEASGYQKKNIGQDQTTNNQGHSNGQFVGQGHNAQSLGHVQANRQMPLGQGHPGAQMSHFGGQMSHGHGQMLMGQGHPNLGQGQMDLKPAADGGVLGSKEQFHAVAVLHLKDKLLRKFDSMENLQKIDKESPPLLQLDVGKAAENQGIPKTCPYSRAGQQQQQQQQGILKQGTLEHSLESAFSSQGFPSSIYHSILASCPVTHSDAMTMSAAVAPATYSPLSTTTTSSKQNVQVSSSESRSQTDSGCQKGVEQYHPLNLTTSKVEESHIIGHALTSVPIATTDTTMTSPIGFAAAAITSSNQTTT